MQKTTITTIDQYIKGFDKRTQGILEKMRKTIHETVPGLEETIGYGIPTFKINGRNLVHFAGYENHIGFYPGSRPIEDFKPKLLDYKTSKGTVQFSLDRPIPYDLVKKMTEWALAIEKNRKK